MSNEPEYPDTPGPPREVQEDAAARERSMTAGRLAGRAIMLWRKTCCVEEIPDIDILEGHVEAAIRAAQQAAYEDCARYHEEKAAEQMSIAEFGDKLECLNGPALVVKNHNLHAANLRERGKSNAG